ncbi:MAG: outer membrane beta-barrel protein [Bacteroidales bacterium]|jgi:hypothetical protein|nr:outer membrane beta-barrel protein [Bacteroidales bacterium]
MNKLKNFILLALLLATISVNAQNDSINKCDEKINHHNFSMFLGYGLRLSSSPSDIIDNNAQNEEHFKTIRHGIQINFAYEYMLKPFLGLGFKASAFNSYDGFFHKGITGDSVEYKDDTYIFYVGPSIKYVLPKINDKLDLYIRGTLGYLSFRDSQQRATAAPSTGKLTATNATYTAKTLGYGLDCGIDYSINDYLSLGFNFAFLGGEVSNFKFGEDKLKAKESENLSRLNFSLGVVIKL